MTKIPGPTNYYSVFKIGKKPITYLGKVTGENWFAFKICTFAHLLRRYEFIISLR